MTDISSDVNSMIKSVEELAKSLGIPIGSGNSNQTINVTASGPGIFICTVCCALMIGITIGGTSVILNQGQQISDQRNEISELRKEISGLNDYLSVIYQQLPSLKKMENKDENAPAE